MGLSYEGNASHAVHGPSWEGYSKTSLRGNDGDRVLPTVLVSTDDLLLANEVPGMSPSVKSALLTAIGIVIVVLAAGRVPGRAGAHEREG